MKTDVVCVSHSAGSANESRIWEGSAIITPERRHNYYTWRRWEWCASPGLAGSEGMSTDRRGSGNDVKINF